MRTKVIALVAYLSFLLVACGPAATAVPPTATPMPATAIVMLTLTPVPPPATTTPTASLTPIPPTVTETPPPTKTPTATSTPIPDYDQLVQLFNYDKDLPLDFVLESQERQGNATVQTISYAGGMGFRVPAYLVLPGGKEPWPAVVYLHKGAGDKDQFLSEALMLADMNVASLLLDSPFVPYPYGGDEIRDDYPGTNREGSIRQVIDIQRGVDLLEAFPEIDVSRIGYVGHSHGATHGGIVIGIETRIRAYVLVAGLAQLSAMQASAVSAPGMVAQKLDPDLDAIHYVGHGSPASVLFQFAELDHHISRGEARLFFDAASEPKTILWYTADHLSIEWEGRPDRLQWLGDQLAFAYQPED